MDVTTQASARPIGTPIAQVFAGQRVKWVTTGGGTRWGRRGTVERVTASTVLIVPDNGGHPVAADLARVNANRLGVVALEILTPHELALEAWVARRPVTSAVKVNTESAGWILADAGAPLVVHLDDRSLRGVTEDITVEQALARVVAEAEQLNRWIAERPAAPQER